MTPTNYQFLGDFLKKRSGLVLSADKTYLVESRLNPIARRLGFAGLDALVEALRGGRNASLEATVTEAMTTNESSFFRDKTPFERLKSTILPNLIEARSAQKRINIWCAAASTGQEPYSIAITLKEMEAQMRNWRLDILGTDISPAVLEKAKAGIYSQFEVQRGLPIQTLVKYFSQDGESWRIDPSLRSMVRYREFNLLESFNTLGTFDIVFCRNVLIYFDRQTKSDILNRIAKSMSPDGYLLLGAAETIIGLTDAFEPVKGERGLYAPKGAASASSPSLKAVAG